ncbi:hypothetical protein ELB75_07810 [Eikenella corrodens]|uniref:Uncharacterized protein n=2 Tax=Eikenella corrodens TaxID=539 RepID=A0A3S9SMS6_EIKCO|nr:hypothetical protein ELB75_07810 [Eikenella corrodens]
MPRAQTPEQIVQRHYRNYSQQHRCFRASPSDAELGYNADYGGEFCMRQTKREIRQTAQGRLMYLLYTGDRFDFGKGESTGGRVQSGLAGIFVLKQVRGGWQLLAAKPYIEIGTYGVAPEAKYWSFRQFGRARWGFMTPMSYLSHGYASSEILIFTHNGAGKVSESRITTKTNNGYILDNCRTNRDTGQPNTPAERQKCRGEWHKLSASFRIMPHARPTAGFYPLQLTVSGFDGFKRYRNQTFLIHYNAAQESYVEPRTYPLANK